MTTSTTIHNSTSITTDGVSHHNANAITLTVETKSVRGTVPHDITIFGLPTQVADALEELFGSIGVAK
jgi:hypothetical protein